MIVVRRSLAIARKGNGERRREQNSAYGPLRRAFLFSNTTGKANRMLSCLPMTDFVSADESCIDTRSSQRGGGVRSTRYVLKG